MDARLTAGKCVHGNNDLDNLIDVDDHFYDQWDEKDSPESDNSGVPNEQIE
jgi:hypothetical protein